MQNKPNINKDLITVSEAARALEVSEQTARNYEARGILKGFRLSNGVRIFRREDVDQFIESRKWRRNAL